MAQLPRYYPSLAPLADLLIGGLWVSSVKGGRLDAFKVRVLRNRVALTLFATHNGKPLVAFVSRDTVLGAMERAATGLASGTHKWYRDQYRRNKFGGLTRR